MFGVARFDKLIAPDGLVMATEVVPVTRPLPEILPEPVAVKVTVLPVSAEPTTIELLLPVSINERAEPVAFIELVVEMPPLAESVRLNPPVPAVEEPLPVSATESVSETLPVLPTV